MENLDKVRDEILAQVGTAQSLAALEETRVATLGRNGRVTQLMKTLGGLDADARKSAGAALNRLKDEVTNQVPLMIVAR